MLSSQNRKRKNFRKNNAESPNQYGAFLHSGLTMAISMLIWVGLGYLADQKFHTRPWFFIAGLFLGLFSVFYESYKLIRWSLKMEKKSRKKNETKNAD